LLLPDHGARAVPGGDIIPLHIRIIERFGAEPEQGLIFLQERLHGPVGIFGVEHLRRGFGHGDARAAGTGQIFVFF
jgi:hypothetical protein